MDILYINSPHPTQTDRQIHTHTQDKIRIMYQLGSGKYRASKHRSRFSNVITISHINLILSFLFLSFLLLSFFLFCVYFIPCFQNFFIRYYSLSVHGFKTLRLKPSDKNLNTSLNWKQ